MNAKILLIQPSWQGLGFRRKIKVNERLIRPLAAATVAALCGNREVRVMDESVEPVPRDLSAWDLIGITVYTFNAQRAFAIADAARAQGKVVVLGGPHLSLAREDCLLHADAVVVGDAEGAFETLLADHEAGRLKREYAGCGNGTVAIPRRDLMRGPTGNAAWMQVSRGCTNSCSFCYLHAMPEREMRFKPLEEAVKELASLREEIILFVDDNLFCARDYALKFFRAITPLGKKWWMQAPANIVDDPELLEAAAASGCFCLSIGFQTVNPEAARREKIFHNPVHRYGELVGKLHSLGIFVDGTFIFGFDSDTPESFRATKRMIKETCLNTYTFYFLTPYPGLGQHAEWVAQGRLPRAVSDDFDWEHPMLKPAGMTAGELAGGIKGLYAELDRFYCFKSLARALLTMPRRNLTAGVVKFIIATGAAYYFSRPLLGRELEHA